MEELLSFSARLGQFMPNNLTPRRSKLQIDRWTPGVRLFLSDATTHLQIKGCKLAEINRALFSEKALQLMESPMSSYLIYPAMSYVC